MRKSNFELLRIVSMFLIVMSHCDDRFGLAKLYSTSLGANKIITDWLDAGGQIGVGCFLLISGYFMIEQTVSVKKVLRLAGQVWFYSIGFFAIWLIVNLIHGKTGGVMKEAILGFFPITFGEYWFVTAYIMLMILSPFLNKFIHSLSHKEYLTFLACIITIFVVLQGGIPFVFNGVTGGRLIPFFIYYFVAGYLRRFGVAGGSDFKRHLFVAAVFYCGLIASCYLLTLLGVSLNNGTIIEHSSRYRLLNSPIVFVICLELFIGFMEMDVKSSRIINEIAGCTFGVYLIQSNRVIRRVVAYLFPIYKETRPNMVFLYSVGGVLLIYISCTVIDFIRKKTAEKWWISMLDSHIVPIWHRLSGRPKLVLSNAKMKLYEFYGATR